MTDQGDEFIPGENVFDDNNPEKFVVLFGTNFFQIFNGVLSKFLWLCRLFLVAFGEFIFRKLMAKTCFSGRIV